MNQAVALINRCLEFSKLVFGPAALLCFGMFLSACDSSSSGIDPGIVEIPIAYIDRPIPEDENGDPEQTDVREPLIFSRGGDVYLRTDTSTDGSITNITRSVTKGKGDVKGLNASADGSKLIFSLRKRDPDPDDDEVPAWDVYEYNLNNNRLRRIIAIDSTAEAGNDLFPAYLPDGRDRKSVV